jgi:hypothetical protein
VPLRTTSLSAITALPETKAKHRIGQDARKE